MTPFAKLCVTFALLVAMAGSGFAHRAPTAALDESLLAYVAVGGSLSDLCGEGGVGTGAGNTCDACRLVDAAAVPHNDTMATVTLHALELQDTTRGYAALVGQITNPSCPARAPPVV